MLESIVPRRRSLEGREWVDPAQDYDEVALQALCWRLNISPLMARILAHRRLLDTEAALRFLNPQDVLLHPPELMRGMQEAVERLHHAVERFERIVVFGDYDVDGTSATSILYSYLKRLGARACYYIPHRILDGYGFTPATVHKLHATGADLVVTADHGSTEVQAPRLLGALGMDLIITDHHQLGAERPEAAALVNPQQPDCPYPFKGLSATGVAFKVVCALDQHLTEADFWNRHGLRRTNPAYYLDLVALATVADMSPLVGENRTLVKLGLEQLNANPRPGLAGLIKECHLHGPVTPAAISFKLAPKINALGRIGDPRLGVQLLVSHSYTEARRLARHMVQLNRERQQVEQRVFVSAQLQAQSQAHRSATVLVGGDWHPGVLGSIASKIAFQTGKPTVVLTLSQQPQVLGSARGGGTFNILQVLEACAPLLIRYGGHPSAAGLALDPANLELFTERVHQAMEALSTAPCGGEHSPLEIEAWIDAQHLTLDLVHELALLSPFGHCNPEPVLAVRGLQLGPPAVIQNRHLRFPMLCPNGIQLDAFAWDHSGWSLDQAQRYDIAFMPQQHEGHHGPRAQVRVLDVMQSE